MRYPIIKISLWGLICNAITTTAILATLGSVIAPAAQPDVQPRARDLGVPFEGTTGRNNAITDVHGIEVGHVTLISGEGKLVVGKGPVRTGVTAIMPRGRNSRDGVFAGFFSLNGNGEMTGTAWIEESGVLDGPVMITNTHSVGVVRDAVIGWLVERDPSILWSLPVVTETWDGFLNDLNGFHVKPTHVREAIDNARGGPVAEGSVGSGTGMICYRFKGGIGTSSRVLTEEEGAYVVGVLVQANHGMRKFLKIAGVPVGREITDLQRTRGPAQSKGGSIIIIVATDAPLLPHQLKRLARRAAMGLARTGSVAEHTSGDLFLAFSTANQGATSATTRTQVEMLPNDQMTPLFAATVEATEEAIINALVAGKTMTGINGNKVHGLPHNRLRKILMKHNLLTDN